QLESRIREKLATYIKYPQVSIMMRSYTGSKIIVMGEVNLPGIYRYQGGMNLLETIAGAGDFTGDARQDSVIVVRGNFTENPQVMRVNLSRVLKKGTSESNLALMPKDVVYVPKSFIANLQRFLGTISPAVSKATSMMGIRELRNVHNLQDLVGTDD
ncbi:MAG: SLBB domain-containing protein, partial [Candidatus Omnitrophica bacterium]|nr:SLBB domain-containing protein [Candidatus Omnitrophota bacterium]